MCHSDPPFLRAKNAVHPRSRARHLLRLSSNAYTEDQSTPSQPGPGEVHLFGYEVQVYGQTVFRSSTQGEAEKLARDLCRALG